MQLQTKVENITPRSELRFADKYVLLGSCFTEHIAQQMRNAYMQVCENPFGVLYNPLSIATCLDILLSDKVFTDKDLTYHDGLYHSMLHHGRFSTCKSNKTLEMINSELAQAREFINSCPPENLHFIITFGTAYTYLFNNNVVSNCHKMPQHMFQRCLLTQEQIVRCWTELLNKHDVLKHVVFTVSPIRHLKDGLHCNQLSKATLLLSINELINNAEDAEKQMNSKPDDNIKLNDIGRRPAKIDYFPAYEIVLDELRDYRFYADDMLHPSNIAIKYVWEQFCSSSFSEAEQMKIKEAVSVSQMNSHRLLHADSPAAKQFESSRQEKNKHLKLKYPWIENYLQ